MSATPTEFEVELVSGKYVSVVRPEGAEITLNDIATMLAKTCRYGGACRGFYSVAEHAVLVADKLRRMGAPLHLQFAGLHHDDAEALLSDILRPVKLAKRSLLPEFVGDPDAQLTAALDLAVCRALAWQGDQPLWMMHDLHDPLVKRVDVWACSFEASQIMPSRGENWEQTWLQQDGEHPVPAHDEDVVRCLEWSAARDLFMRTHLWLLVAAVRAEVAA